MSQTHERRPPGQGKGAATTTRDTSTSRRLRPRAPVVIAAVYVSQLTCTALLGVDDRRYLDVIVPACKPDVVHVGKLRLVELTRAVEALRAMVVGEVSAERGHGPAQPEDVDGVLRELGLEVAR